MSPQMLTESARRCLGALRKKRLDGLAQRDDRRRGCFAGGIQRETTAIGVPRSGPSRLDCSASGLGACRLELPSIQAALGRTIQAALGPTIQAALERTIPVPSERVGRSAGRSSSSPSDTPSVQPLPTSRGGQSSRSSATCTLVMKRKHELRRRNLGGVLGHCRGRLGGALGATIASHIRLRASACSLNQANNACALSH